MIGTTNAAQESIDIVSYDFSSASWEEIAQLSANGGSDFYFNVGDSKTVQSDSGDFTATIVAMNYDDTGVTSEKVGITLCVKSNRLYYPSQIPSEEIIEESLPIDIPIKTVSKGRVFYVAENDIQHYSLDYLFDDPNARYWLPYEELILTKEGIEEPLMAGDRAPSAGIFFCFCI